MRRLWARYWTAWSGTLALRYLGVAAPFSLVVGLLVPIGGWWPEFAYVTLMLCGLGFGLFLAALLAWLWEA
jgi:hypothetical protein